ncbi:hypothetical protein, partial [Streptomyces sp. NPDC019539]|uniref:hypothetical protein n=1 Tax=Streptomyces sp. NPDC019539 TaxID=3365063 RepID=UPI0037907546
HQPNDQEPCHVTNSHQPFVISLPPQDEKASLNRFPVCWALSADRVLFGELRFDFGADEVRAGRRV